MDQTIADIVAEIRTKSEDISFLSEVDLNKDSLSYVRSHVDDILRSKTGSEDECIAKVFTLVDIGCRFYQENTYWPHVVRERNGTSKYGCIDCLEPWEKENYIQSFHRGLDALGLRHGRVTPRSIEGILIHSFVPDYKMDDFFDFLCDSLQRRERGINAVCHIFHVASPQHERVACHHAVRRRFLETVANQF